MLWKLFNDGYKTRDIYLSKREAENIISVFILHCPYLCSSVQAAKCLWSTKCPEWACFAFCSADSENLVDSLPLLANDLLISAEISFSWHLHSEFFKGFFYVLNVKTKVRGEKSSWKHVFQFPDGQRPLTSVCNNVLIPVWCIFKTGLSDLYLFVHTKNKSNGLMNLSGNWLTVDN